MKIGQLVMIVRTDGSYMPPLGAVGEIKSPLDEEGDHDVLFPRHPCPVPPEVTWCTPARWLIPLSEGLYHYAGPVTRYRTRTARRADL